MNESTRSPVTGFITISALVFLFVPLGVVLLFSFHASGSLSFPFEGFSLRWYRDLMVNENFREAVANSMFIATVTAAVTLVVGTLAAYGLSRSPVKLQPVLSLVFFLPLTLPGLFLGLSLLVMFAEVNISLSMVTVAAAHLIYVLPYFMLIAVGALQRLDPALNEAAEDLGAPPRTVFSKVILPQVWPVILGATFLAFALSFDEFIITFFVIGPDSTLPMFIWSSLRRTIDPSINTISSVLLAATLLLFVIAFAFTVRAERQRRMRIDEAIGIGRL